MAALTPDASFIQANIPNNSQTILIKRHCRLCSCYHDCPRMRGESMCLGQKEIIPIASAPPSYPSSFAEETKDEPQG